MTNIFRVTHILQFYFMNFSASVTKYEKRGKYLRSCKWLQENNYFIAIKIYSNQVFNKYV